MTTLPRARVVQLRGGEYIVEILCRTLILRRPHWLPLARHSKYEVTTSHGSAFRFPTEQQAEEAARLAVEIRSRPVSRVVSEVP